MKPVRTVPKKANAILLMMPSCESEEQSKENEQRQQLSEAHDRIERPNLEEVELSKQDFEAVHERLRKEGFSRRIDKNAQAERERKRNGTQKKPAGRTERVNRLRKAIAEGDVMRMAVEIAGMEEPALLRKEMAERALKQSRGNERERRGSGASRNPSRTGGPAGRLAQEPPQRIAKRSESAAGNSAKAAERHRRGRRRGRRGIANAHRGGAGAAAIPAKAGNVDGGAARRGGNGRRAQSAHQLAGGSGAGTGSDADEAGPGSVEHLVEFVEEAAQSGEFRTARIEGPILRSRAIERVVNGRFGAKAGDDELRLFLRQLQGKRAPNECT